MTIAIMTFGFLNEIGMAALSGTGDQGGGAHHVSLTRERDNFFFLLSCSLSFNGLEIF
jgi:hypothetical protein